MGVEHQPVVDEIPGTSLSFILGLQKTSKTRSFPVKTGGPIKGFQVYIYIYLYILYINHLFFGVKLISEFVQHVPYTLKRKHLGVGGIWTPKTSSRAAILSKVRSVRHPALSHRFRSPPRKTTQVRKMGGLGGQQIWVEAFLHTLNG